MTNEINKDGAFDEITDEKKAKSMLTNEMAFKLDQVAMKHSCEYQSYYKDTLSLFINHSD